MNTVYNNSFLLLILFLTIFFSWRSFAQVQTKTISIKKAFHHKGKRTNGEMATDIEAGSLVFYFSSMPSLIPVARVAYDGSYETQTFFLPATVIAQDSRRMIERINQDHAQPYSIHIRSASTPQKGIEIVIRYPRDSFQIECKQFEAIGRDKGLVFYIYNKKVLDALRTYEQPLMKMAFAARHPPCIFIDNGHGGSDTGAIGNGDVKEKDVCLHVGTYLAELLKENGYQVVMSRSTDQDVPLDQRTTTANRSQADVFVSIHANSAGNKAVHGIETFCMQPFLLGRLYSGMDTKTIALTEAVIAQRSQQSYKLAQLVQKNLCMSVTSYQEPGYDRGVKHAVAQVFFSHMPAILVELGFLTNSVELNLLTTDSYQHLLAHSIFQGITDYFHSN